MTVWYQPPHLSNTSSFCLNSSPSILVTEQLRKWIYSLPSPAWLSIQINLTGTSKSILNFLMWEAASQPKGNQGDYSRSKSCIMPTEESNSGFAYFKILIRERSFILKKPDCIAREEGCVDRLWQGIHASLSSSPPTKSVLGASIVTHITFEVLNLTLK